MLLDQSEYCRHALLDRIEDLVVLGGIIVVIWVRPRTDIIIDRPDALEHLTDAADDGSILRSDITMEFSDDTHESTLIVDLDDAA